ncbi:glycosyltransferase family 2 protein [Alteraurantiacibacter aquimixticola]|uniref:Glycosyltransferase family 2 protein n=1 Tax=Alteraurantiacibacter aquimixticola TaxID=2489173 RepID=A0A4T3EWN1_9SPHN|nr:glycosyltransferase family 2 protein [Alteraurantiacibacter aquimixticola]TIX48975.1 glycosyltransferase family 2 protein [Alteraurantiacibacter aquimixticola]
MKSHSANAPAPEVSVVIPAYRAARFISNAIDSVLAQEGVSYEVIVVDDECPERTADKVTSTYEGDTRVRAIRLDRNQGPAGARNAGFREAKGEWIAVLDADDTFDLGRLARLVRAGREFHADLVADNVRVYDAVAEKLSGRKITSINQPEWIDLPALLRQSRPDTGQLDYGLLKPCFRSQFVASLPELYPTAVRHGEDFQFYVRCLVAGGRFLLLPEPGYRWTSRNSGFSQTKTDYLGMARDSRALKNAAGISGNADYEKLLEERAEALSDFFYASAQRGFKASLQQRRYLRAIRSLIKHPFLRKNLIANLFNKG